MRTARSIAVLIALLALRPNAAGAQRLSGTIVGYSVQHRVLFAGEVYEQTGAWVGVGGAVRLGKVQLGVGGLFGALSGDDPSTNPERDVRSSSLAVSYAVTPALSFGVEAEARHFETPVGASAWRLLGVRARATPAMGIAGLEGVAEVAFYPSATVIDGPTISPAFRTMIGVSYGAPRSPMLVQIGYRFERYDVEGTGGSTRFEQFRGVTAVVGRRFGRSWTRWRE